LRPGFATSGFERTRTRSPVRARCGLKVRPRLRAKAKLADKGRVRVSLHVPYTPTGGEPNTRSKKIKLIEP
jgi:hypothetical protein